MEKSFIKNTSKIFRIMVAFTMMASFFIGTATRIVVLANHDDLVQEQILELQANLNTLNTDIANELWEPILDEAAPEGYVWHPEGGVVPEADELHEEASPPADDYIDADNLPPSLQRNLRHNVWHQTGGHWFFYVNGNRQQGWIQTAGRWYFLNPASGNSGHNNNLPIGAMRDG